MATTSETRSLSLTVQNVREELGIDTIDEAIDNKIKRYIKLADAYLKGAIGEQYPRDDERAIELALLVIEDLYDRNATTIKENNTIARLKDDFLLQLKVEGMNEIQSSNSNTKIN